MKLRRESDRSKRLVDFNDPTLADISDLFWRLGIRPEFRLVPKEPDQCPFDHFEAEMGLTPCFWCGEFINPGVTVVPVT